MALNHRLQYARWPRTPMHNTSPHVAMSRNGEPPSLSLAWRAARQAAATRSLFRSRPGTLANKPSLAIFYILHPRPQPSTVVGALPRESCGTIVCKMASHCSPFIFRPLVTLPSFVDY